MKTTDIIGYKIDRLPKGYIFTYKDFIADVYSTEAIIKTLNRMVNSGKISKLSRGRYYKPETTILGNIQPDQYQIVKDLLEKDGKIIGYVTGFGIYNQLGLTTQVSNLIQIGRNEKKNPIKRGRFKISFIKQKNTITKENIYLLQVLDSIRNMKKIPDTGIDKICIRLVSIIKELNENDKERIVRLSMKYPPATRAFLGAILESSGYRSENLKKSLNPISKYDLGIPEEKIPFKNQWNIV